MSFDIVIRNGTVFDGTGAGPKQQDIAIENGRIKQMGDVGSDGADEIDAGGLLVTPGFIDMHSHSDHTILVDPRAVSAIHQGVTLEVIGNCGHGCFPIHDAQQAQSPIYGFTDAVPLTWHSAAEYFRRLEQAKPAVNMLSLVPNGQLRLAAVGLRDGPVNRLELREMTRLLEEALEQGAWGLSTGLEYPWEEGAPEEEITALCKTVAGVDGLYATHTRLRDEGSVGAVEEAVRTAANAGVALQVSHLLPRNGIDAGRQCIEVVDAARENGVDVTFDMHTRTFGTNYLHNALPPWAREGGTKEMSEKLADKVTRESMKSYRSILSAGGDWSRIVLLDNPYWPEYARQDVATIARDRGQSALDAVYDLLLGGIEDTRQLMIIINCHTEEQLRETFSHSLCMPGSDATALAPDGPLQDSTFHGAYTWASWFYRFMVREQKALSAAEAIHRLTGMPAARLGLSDRGVLKEGAWADLALFSPEQYRDRGTTYEPNLVAGGMVHVIVNGLVGFRDGHLTDERAGAVLRRD